MLDRQTEGCPIGLTDKCGDDICIGDTLYFIDKDKYFTIKIRRGEIVGFGSPDNWESSCVIVARPPRQDYDRGDGIFVMG